MALKFILCLLIALLDSSLGVSQMKWCTISSHEETKCVAMRTAFAAQNMDLAVVCVAGDSVMDCLENIEGGRADMITLDGGDIYTAGKEYGLVPIVQETYETDTYYAIAVVKASDASITIVDLEGKKSCHTGVRRTAGWNVPVGFLLEQGYMQPTDCGDDINAVANFFNESCAPGAFSAANDPYSTNPANLCGICTNPQCPPDASELYQSYSGAFRCLAEGAGDVAFIKPQTVIDNTDENSQQGTWNAGLQSADFSLLCPDGSRSTIENAASCNLAKSPAHAVVTSGTKSSADIAAFKDVLQEAVVLFGDDNNANGFFMFESSMYGDGRDSLFKDTAQSLKNIGAGMSYRDYLGTYADTIDGLKKCPENSLRWCTTSPDETRKCRDMKAAFKEAGLTPELACYEETDSGLCMDRLAAGDADVLTVDGGDLYVGGRQDKVVAVAGEDYGDFGEEDGDASYWAVAVARAGTQFGMDDLMQRTSCHTGIGKTSGWNVPVGHLIKKGDIVVDEGCDVPPAVGAFFSAGSCAPGAKSAKYDPDGDNPSSLCSKCIGTGADHCVRNKLEPYYGYSGAFRCLAEEAGDVAFVKHTTVAENTGTEGSQGWNDNLRSEDYELLCPDNTRAPTSQWKTCNLAKVPSHTVVTATSKTAAQRREIWNLLNQAQNLFSSDDGNNFKMFDSEFYGQSDLLFKDMTLRLVDVGERDTYKEWLSEEYLTDLEALYCEYTGRATTAAQASLVLTILALIVQAVWIGAQSRE